MQKIFKIVGVFILSVAGGILSSQIILRYNRLEPGPVYVTERKQITIQENTALENAIEKTADTVVGVKTKIPEIQEVLQGSGLVATSDGLVVTLADLVPQGAVFNFLVNGKAVSYQILKRDLRDNLALIKIEETSLPTAGFADLDELKLGQRVFLVGQGLANEGIVRSFNKDSIETNIFEKKDLAGTPLFDIEGNVLGLNTIDPEGRVVAIPVSKIKQFIGF